MNIARDNLSLRWIPQFLNGNQSQALLAQLIEITPWQQPKVTIYGKSHSTPRLLRFYGDKGLNYQYSNTVQDILDWTPTLFKLKTQVELETAQSYNSVLLNYYRDGRDTMGWHADDEAELGAHPNIASLSLGAGRDIHFKPKRGQHKLVKMPLHSGDLLIMHGATQQHWLHHIPKRTRCNQARINLTFRNILSV